MVSSHQVWSVVTAALGRQCSSVTCRVCQNPPFGPCHPHLTDWRPGLEPKAAQVGRPGSHHCRPCSHSELSPALHVEFNLWGALGRLGALRCAGKESEAAAWPSERMLCGCSPPGPLTAPPGTQAEPTHNPDAATACNPARNPCSEPAQMVRLCICGHDH